MIVVVPEGGLCNRMRVVASAALLARQARQPLHVKWYQTADFNCRFDRLFDVSALDFSVDEMNGSGALGRLWRKRRDPFLKLRGFVVYGEALTEPGHFDAQGFLRHAAQRDMWIHTNSRLVQEPGMYDRFKPAGRVAELIMSTAAGLDRAVGVHVRRGDNVMAQQHSPFHRFIELMREELQEDASTRFFVATDEPGCMEELRREFGASVSEYSKRAYSRDDPIAIEDAMVDLYCLGRCRKLIGSYWSSFTDTAAELRQIPYVIARG